MSKDDQKKLSKENNSSFNTLKKINVRIVKKIGPALTEYKKNRKTEEELEKDSSGHKRVQKKVKMNQMMI